MSNLRYLLATCLALPCGAALVWALTPELPLPAEDAAPPTFQAQSPSFPATSSQGEALRSDSAARPANPRSSGDLSAVLAQPAAPVRQSASTYKPAYSASSRSSGSAVSTARAESSEPQIRVVSSSGVPTAGATSANEGSPVGTAPGSFVVEVGSGLHDPIAWTQNEVPMGPAQEALKGQIANQFSAEVATALADPEAAKKGGLDKAWRDARDRADWEYRKFFGDAAANQAALATGREAVAQP